MALQRIAQVTLVASRRGGGAGRAFIVISLLSLIMSACGVTPTTPAGSGGGLIVTETQGPAAQMNTIGAATVKNVQVRATVTCGPWVVLASHAATYSQSELAAIQQYVSQHTGSIVGADNEINTYTPGAASSLPATLRFVQGYPTCSGEYDVTNTGHNLIQVNGAGFQPTQAPAAFSYSYHLLDGCPYMHSCICHQCGAAFGCVYATTIAMTMSQSGVMGMFGPSVSPACPLPINLQPGATIPLMLTFDKPKGDEAVWFRGMPALSVTTDSGTVTLTYPSLLNNLVFADFGDHTTGAKTGAAIQPRYNGDPGLAAQDTNIQVTCHRQSGNTLSSVVTAYRTIFTLSLSRADSSLCF